MADYKKIKASQLSVEPTGVYISGELYCEKEEDFWADVALGKIIVEGDVSDQPTQVNPTPGTLVVDTGDFDRTKEASDLYIRLWDEEESEGFDICNFGCDETKKAKEYATEFVRRYNAFPGMLEALKRCVPYLESLQRHNTEMNPNGWDEDKELTSLISESEAAIQLATTK